MLRASSGKGCLSKQLSRNLLSESAAAVDHLEAVTVRNSALGQERIVAIQSDCGLRCRGPKDFQVLSLRAQSQIVDDDRHRFRGRLSGFIGVIEVLWSAVFPMCNLGGAATCVSVDVSVVFSRPFRGARPRPY